MTDALIDVSMSVSSFECCERAKSRPLEMWAQASFTVRVLLFHASCSSVRAAPVSSPSFEEFDRGFEGARACAVAFDAEAFPQVVGHVAEAAEFVVPYDEVLAAASAAGPAASAVLCGELVQLHLLFVASGSFGLELLPFVPWHARNPRPVGIDARMRMRIRMCMRIRSD
ncbi:hypothetical protein [Streptomyces sp. KLOTTS4A1]|uniref:hypothetical protein n=1 Tax=Streptomyces sp. KLOTTS4A1 TaxID=3390996 RepID=UPI0039F5672C